MKRILPFILLLCFSLSLTAQNEHRKGRLVINPITGKLEMVANIYAMPDLLINSGYDNYPFSSLNMIFGWGNSLNENSIALGWTNYLMCDWNFVIGKGIRCDGDKNISIGQGFHPSMPGSVSFGYFCEKPILTVHNGYSMPNDGYVGDIGGVRIGDRRRSYNDDSTALEITGYEQFKVIGEYGTPPGTQLIATQNDQWTVTTTGMELAGTLYAGYMDCEFVPRVYSGSSDTSLLPIPFKAGDYYIHTSARDVYISTGVVRGTWKKVN